MSGRRCRPGERTQLPGEGTARGMTPGTPAKRPRASGGAAHVPTCRPRCRTARRARSRTPGTRPGPPSGGTPAWGARAPLVTPGLAAPGPGAPGNLPHLTVMRITVLAGGVGAARFLRGLRRAAPEAEITVIGNTGDDITLFGLRVCPDLDTVMYTLGGGINEDQGWGRAGETFSIRAELAAYDASPDWFTLGDRDFATHILRSRMLADGQPLSAVTEELCRRWQPGVRLLPMSDDPVQTHVVLAGPRERRPGHFQECWGQLD